MKILITRGLGANSFVRRGWANNFKLLGHEVVLWAPNEVPAFDLFHDFKPDLFLGSSWDLDSATPKCLAKLPNCKVILNTNDYNNNLKDSRYPIDWASEEEIEKVRRLKEMTGKPDFITTQYPNDEAQLTHEMWKHFAPVFGLPLSADTTEFYPVNPSKDWNYDISIVSGFWPYKSKYLRQYMVKFSYPNTKLRLASFGQGWSGPQSYPSISNELVKHLYCSSLINLNVHEPHSVERYTYDVNQRTYQVCAAGGFQICHTVPYIKEKIYTNNEVVFVDSQEEFLEKVLYFKKNPLERIPYIERGTQTVWADHTTMYRVARMLQLVGFEEESRKALKIVDENEVKMLDEQPAYLKSLEEFYVKSI